jgi:glucose-6-phosphate isomerase
LLTAVAEGLQPNLTQPQLLLDEYKTRRRESLLGRILALAKQLRDVIDCAVVLGPPVLVSPTQALFQACCHPYHNDLSRGQRGGRPRIHFVSAVADNDAIQALLETLPHGRPLQTSDESWGIVALDDCCQRNGNGNPLVAGLFSIFWDALQSTTTATEEVERVAVVGLVDSSLVTLAEEIGIPWIAAHESNSRSVDDKSSAWEAEFDVITAQSFHPGVLLAASVMGMDIVKLLRGAAMMMQRFQTAPPGDNPPLDFAGLCHLLLEQRGNAGRRVFSPCSALHRLAQNLQSAGGGDDLLIQWMADEVRHDRLHVALPSGETADGRVRKTERLLTDVAAQQAEGVRQARTAAGKPTVVVRLPIVDEGAVGQLLQLFSLATEVENLLSDGVDC